MAPLKCHTRCDGVFLSENEVSKLNDQSKPWKERKPIGFRFNPSDRALANIYGAKVLDRKDNFVLSFFKDIDVYDLEPSELSGDVNEFGEGKVYLFTRIKDKHSTNRRIAGRTMFARTAGGGCWKKNGKISDITADVEYNSEKLIVRKTPLAFFKKDKTFGKEERTPWLMEEYMLKDRHCLSSVSNSEIFGDFSRYDRELLRDLFQSGNEHGSNQQQPNSHGSSDPIQQQHITDSVMGCYSSQQNLAGITLIADQLQFNNFSLHENMHTLGAFDSDRNDFPVDNSSDSAATATAFDLGSPFSCSDQNMFICGSSSRSMNHIQLQLGQCDESPNSVVTIGPKANLLSQKAYLDNNPIKSINRPVLSPAPTSYENGENSGEKSGILALCVIYMKGGKQQNQNCASENESCGRRKEPNSVRDMKGGSCQNLASEPSSSLHAPVQSSLRPSKRHCRSSVSTSEAYDDLSPIDPELLGDWPVEVLSDNEHGSTQQQQQNSHGSSDPILQKQTCDQGMGCYSSQQYPAGTTSVADQPLFNQRSLPENMFTAGASYLNRNDFSIERQEKSPFLDSAECSGHNYQQLSFEKPSLAVGSCSINATTNAVEDLCGQSHESSTRIDYSSATAMGFEQGPPVSCSDQLVLSEKKLDVIKNTPVYSPDSNGLIFYENRGHQYSVNELRSNQQEQPNSYVPSDQIILQQQPSDSVTMCYRPSPPLDRHINFDECVLNGGN